MSAISYTTAIPSHAKMSSSRTYTESAMSNSANSSNASSMLGSYAYHHHNHLQQEQQQQAQLLINSQSSPSSPSSCAMNLLHMNLASTSPPLSCPSPRARKNSRESIHSGHFMISEIDEDAGEQPAKVTTVCQSDIDKEESLQLEKVGDNFPLDTVNKRKEYKYGPDTDPRTVTIDVSLSKLLGKLSMAYRDTITSPKWKSFKGLNGLKPKDKIRLNNIIWRCWHMQYVSGLRIKFCQFATTLDVHNKPEAILLEGKYWKRGEQAVQEEYKKWRKFKVYVRRKELYFRSHKDAYNGSIDLSSSFSESDLRSSNSMTDSFGFDDTFMSSENSLFSSLMTTPNPFGFPLSREINRSGFGVDCIQPCLSQLQPPIYDYMDFDDMFSMGPLSGMGVNVSRNPQVSILPTLPEEPPMDCTVTEVIDAPSKATDTPSTILTGPSSIQLLPQLNTASSCNTAPASFEMSQIPQSSLDNVLPTQYLHENINSINTSGASQLCTQINGIYDAHKKVNTFTPSPSPSEYTFTAPLSRTSNATVTQQQQSQQQQQQQQYSTQVNNDQKPFSRRTFASSRVSTSEANQARFLVPPSPSMGKSSRSIQQHIHHQQVQQQQQQLSVNSSEPQQQQQQQSASSLQSVTSTLDSMYPATLTHTSLSNTITQLAQHVKPSNCTLMSQVNSVSSKVPFERSSSLPIYQSTEFMSQHHPLVTSPSPLAPLPAAASSYQSTSTNLTSDAPRLDNIFLKTSIESALSKDSVIAQLLSSPTPTLSRSHSNQSVLLGGQQQQSQQSTYQTAIPYSSKYASSSSSSSMTNQLAITPYVSSRASAKSESRVRFADDTRTKQSSSSSSSAGPVRKLSSPARICSTHPAAIAPSHLLKEPVSPHSPGKSSKKGNQDKIKYQEHRRVCHINAEQKRRCNIKNGFDTLRNILPCINQSASAKISKAQMLQKAAEHIQLLKADWQDKQSEYESWKKEIDTLNQTINVFQCQLPATGAPVACQRTGRAKEMFRAYVQSRTQENWKFYIFSQIMEPLLESYDSSVSTSSAEELRKSTDLWLDQNCSLVNLRKGVLNSLRHLSTTSSILTNPSALPGEALQAVATIHPSERENRN